MSTLPLLYSARSLDKRPSKQGGIFALQAHNRSSSSTSTSKSIHINMNSTSKIVDSPELNELSRNNITNYYFSNTARHSNASHSRRSGRKSMFGGEGVISNRYAQASFFGQSQKDNKIVMVGPDTIGARLGQHNEVQSVGTLHKSICTSILLFKTLLKASSTQILQLHQNIQKSKQKLLKGVDELNNEIKQKCEILYKNISNCRRQTQMELKVNNAQVEKLTQDTENSKIIAEKIQQKLKYIGKQCEC